MFDNVGKKLKDISKIFFFIEIIAFVISAIMLLNKSDDNFFINLIILIFGYVVAYILALLLYGFGELVENSSTIGTKRTSPHHLPKSLYLEGLAPLCEPSTVSVS